MTGADLIEPDLSYAVIRAFFEVYNTLGYGFLEQLYVEALTLELRDRGHHIEREVPVAVRYKGRVIGKHRMDGGRSPADRGSQVLPAASPLRHTADPQLPAGDRSPGGPPA